MEEGSRVSILHSGDESHAEMTHSKQHKLESKIQSQKNIIKTPTNRDPNRSSVLKASPKDAGKKSALADNGEDKSENYDAASLKTMIIEDSARYSF